MKGDFLPTERRPAFSARGDLGWRGDEFRGLFGQRHAGRGLRIRQRRQARARAFRTAGIHRRGFPRADRRRRAGRLLRPARRRPLRAAGRPSLQPAQAASRPLRARPFRRAGMEPGGVRLHDRRQQSATSRSTSATARRSCPNARSSIRTSTGAASCSRRATPWERTIVYEAHVKGFTRLNPAVPEHLRGTYAGLGVKEVVDYVKSLGRHHD